MSAVASPPSNRDASGHKYFLVSFADCSLQGSVASTLIPNLHTLNPKPLKPKLWMDDGGLSAFGSACGFRCLRAQGFRAQNPANS